MRVADYLDIAAAKFPDREYLVFEENRLTYLDAQKIVHSIAERINRLHIELELRRDVPIGLYSSNDHRVSLVQLGASKADIPYMGVHDRNSVETNAEILEYVDCQVIFFKSEYETQVVQLKKLVPSIIAWICIDKPSSEGEDLERWIKGCANKYPYYPVKRDSIGMFIVTGGTTGNSKAAMHSNRSVEMQIINASISFDFDGDSRLLSVAPLSHAAGQLATALFPKGGTNVIIRGFDPELVLRTIESERITHLFVPPTIIYILMAHPLLRQSDLSSLKCLMVGAAPIPPEKFKEAVRVFGPILYEAFAQTETLIPVLIKRPEDYYRPDGSFDEEILPTAGRASDFSSVEIMDPQGTVLPPGMPGEIVVRSSMGMSGYYKLPEATLEASMFGVHHTGDIGIKNTRGFITIIDRMKDLIISGGFNVYPAEVEAVINEHPAVLDCIVVGVPDEKWGEAVKAIVQLKPKMHVTADEILALCQLRLGGVKTPKSVDMWPELPRSPVGKLLRREARKQFWIGHWRTV